MAVLLAQLAVVAFTPRLMKNHAKTTTTRPRAAVASCLELQRECGRGQEHLSARVQEGDVCVYQVGTWMVDWVPVGPGDPARLLVARADVVQINFTTDCEHGRIIGTPVGALDGLELHIDEDEEPGGIQFGPEQLVARVPATWESDSLGRLSTELPSTLAASLPEGYVQLPVLAE